MNDEPCKLHSLIYQMHAAIKKNNHSKLGSRGPYTLGFISALLQTLYKSKAYIVITDPGIHLATTKTVYLLIGQLVGRSYCRDCQRRAYSLLAAESLFFLAALLSSQPILDSRVSFVCVSILLLPLGVGKRHYGLFIGAVPKLLHAPHYSMLRLT